MERVHHVHTALAQDSRGGCFFKVLDILDERPMTRGEIYLLLQYLLKRSADDDILPRDPEEFCSEVERRLAEDYPGRLGFDPLKKAMAPPVDTRLLRQAMGCQKGLEGIGAKLIGWTGLLKRN